MKAHATGSTAKTKVGHKIHEASFAKVVDARKRAIRGLWVRNGRYYAQLKVENPVTGIKRTRRVPLTDTDGKPVPSTAQAMVALKRLQTQRADNQLPSLERTPRFSDYVVRYLDFIRSGQGTKKASTIGKEACCLARWIEFLGPLRLDQIKRVHVNRFIEGRLKKQLSPRTINIHVIALRVVLKRALEDGILQRLPTEGLRPLKVSTPKRSLFVTADVEAVCRAALETTKNGRQLGDYVRLLALCGARRNEALKLRWEDVDFERGQLTIGAAGDTKNREHRMVDFNPKLRRHLLEMEARRAPDSQWVFPSPQRGEKDISSKSFSESLRLARTKAGLPRFNFHDCRHHFVSMCVMSGVDFMTIAAWVGHKDGGVLIGKVYGHLANEHRKAMAERVNFGPAALQQEQA